MTSSSPAAMPPPHEKGLTAPYPALRAGMCGVGDRRRGYKAPSPRVGGIVKFFVSPC